MNLEVYGVYQRIVKTTHHGQSSRGRLTHWLLFKPVKGLQVPPMNISSALYRTLVRLGAQEMKKHG